MRKRKLQTKPAVVAPRKAARADQTVELGLALVDELTRYREELELQNEELRAAQAQLEESRGRYADLYDSLPVGYVTLDAAGLVRDANLTAAALLGRERRLLLDRTFATYLADRTSHNRFQQHLFRCQTDEGEITTELELRTNGHIVPIQMITQRTPYLDNRHPTALMDIGERRHHERDRERLLARLRRSQHQLERRVISRTKALTESNATLQAEVEARRRLEAQILDVADAEQHRLGQDLHDGLGQQLTGVAYLANSLATQLSEETSPHAKEAMEIAQLVRESIGLTRQLSRGLLPVRDSEDGLLIALKDVADRIRNTFDLDCQVRCHGRITGQNHAAATQLYRIAREAISNAVRHGRPSRIIVTLSTSRSYVTLSVQNNGKPFPSGINTRGGLGVSIMHSRARALGGRITLSPPRSLPTVTCKVPVVAFKRKPVKKLK